MDSPCLRPDYRSLPADAPLRQHIDRIYDLSIGLLLAGFQDAQKAARDGQPWAAIGSESPHVYSGFFIVAPDMAHIRRHCSLDDEFGNEPVDDPAFFRTIANYLADYDDGARYIVDGRLAGWGIVVNSGPTLQERGRALAGIDDTLRYTSELCEKLLPTIATPGVKMGSKTKSAFFNALCCDDAVIIQKTVKDGHPRFKGPTFDYQANRSNEGWVNPVGAGRVVHLSRDGIVRSVSMEISASAPADHAVGYAVDLQRREREDWPVALVERTFRYDAKELCSFRMGEHALDPSVYRALVRGLQPAMR